MRARPRLLIWDFDGTLSDDVPELEQLMAVLGLGPLIDAVYSSGVPEGRSRTLPRSSAGSPTTPRHEGRG